MIMSKEKIFKMIYDASVLIGISSGFGYFINMDDPSTSITDYLKWVIILSGSIYLKDYMQREEILKRIDSLNSKKDDNLNLKKDNKKNLDLKSKRIVNLANPIGDKDAVNKSYADGKVKTTLNSLVSKTGDKITGDLDMSGNEIKNLKEASSSDATFAANVNYVNKTINERNAILQERWQDYVSGRLDYTVDREMENDFKYVLEGNKGDEFIDEQSIKGMGVITSKDFHPFNKRTAHFDLEFKKDFFKSSFAVNLRYTTEQPRYTVVCEMFWDDSVTNLIESATLKASLNSFEVIYAQQSNVFDNHVRTLVRTQRIFSWNPDKLIFDIVIKYRSGVAYPQKLPVYIVFYGSKGFYNNVPTSVWNSWRVFDQGNVSMQKDLILNQDPTVDKGAATKKYVDDNIKLQMKKIFYKGYLKHDNDSFIRFFANGTSDHTKYVRQSDHSDFIVNEEDEERILIKNPGVYSISLIDGLKTPDEDDNGTVQFILNPAPFLSLSDNINITVPNTGKGWKTYNFISVLDIYKDTKLSIQTSDARTIFDGLGEGYKKFGMILINKID